MKLLVETKRRLESGQWYRYGIFKCPLCYNFTEVRYFNGIRNKSCGCIHFTHKSSRINGKHTHLYGVWGGIKYRCLCKTAHNYYRYGGRGIKICEEWKDFSIFKDWALSNGYKDGLTIDRINNDGNYGPSNCQFITSSENSQKTSKTIISQKEADEIRRLYNDCGVLQEELSETYKVTTKQISNIICNKTWRDKNYVRKIYRSRAGTFENKKVNQQSPSGRKSRSNKLYKI